MSECLCFQNGVGPDFTVKHVDRCSTAMIVPVIGLGNCRYHDRQAHSTVLTRGRGQAMRPCVGGRQ